ncbi:LPS export ABC transporter permease LptG [Calditrichota bacterium]
MKLLDKYLIKKFLFDLLFGISAFIAIFLIVDLIENIDKFIDKKATAIQVILYYIYYIPHIISLTLPVGMLLATLFSIGNMTQHNEIVAQKSAGVSLYRIFMPLFITAFVISIFAGLFSETVVPWASQRKYDLYRYDIKKNPRTIGKNRNNIYIQDTANRKTSIGFYNGRTNEAQKVSVLYFDGAVLLKRIDAQTMKWDNQKWTLRNIVERSFEDSLEEVISYPELIIDDLRFKPENLMELQKMPEEMSYTELDEFVDEMQSIGSEARKWLVELYLKISYPFANFIIVLFGAPLAARKRRSGTAVGVGISLLVCFIYFLFIRTGQVFGHQGTLSPFLGAWFGNIIFAVAGLFTLIKARM